MYILSKTGSWSLFLSQLSRRHRADNMGNKKNGKKKKKSIPESMRTFLKDRDNGSWFEGDTSSEAQPQSYPEADLGKSASYRKISPHLDSAMAEDDTDTDEDTAENFSFGLNRYKCRTLAEPSPL